MYKIVGIGEYAVSNNPEETIKTFALASCVALTVYCPIRKVLGMVHIALPDSSINGAGEIINPGYYADTAVPLLLKKVCLKCGCRQSSLKVHLFGGAQSISKRDMFNIGERNIKAVKSLLESFGIVYNSLETGGYYSRTVEVGVATGTALIEKQPIKI